MKGTRSKRKMMKRKTLRCNKSSNKHKSYIVATLLEMKTESYAIHKATDQLLDKLDNFFDRFVEVLLCKCNKE